MDLELESRRPLEGVFGHASDGRPAQDVKLKIRSPSQWSVPARDSDGGSRLSQDDFSDVESFLGETAH